MKVRELVGNKFGVFTDAGTLLFIRHSQKAAERLSTQREATLATIVSTDRQAALETAQAAQDALDQKESDAADAAALNA